MNIRHTRAASLIAALSLLGCNAAPVASDTTDLAAVTVDEDAIALTYAYASSCARSSRATRHRR